MTRLLAPRSDGTAGFSLVELLVIVLIVAVLATIALPVFLSQREKGWTAQMESALKEAATSIDGFNVGANRTYDDATIELLQAEQGLRFADVVNLELVSEETSSQEYCFRATHDKFEGASLYYDSDVGRPSEEACS